jgi:protein TonB
MNTITYNAWNPRHLGIVIVSTALISGLLFAALPWLTRISEREPDNEKVPSHIIFPRTQPKPLEPRIDKRIIDTDLLPPPKLLTQLKTRQKSIPDFDYLVTKTDGGVPVIQNYAEEIDPVWEDIIFDPSQLDQAPRVIRRIKPAYPFAAKRQGIKARVKIKCLVDSDGNPQNIVAAECDPEDALEIFGPPSVEAVKKWRFSPGEIGGDPVTTRVAFHLFFELD